MNEARMTIIQNLEKIMAEKNLNQETLAKNLGVSKGYVSLLLAGKRNFSKKVLDTISEKLGISKSELVSGKETNGGDYLILLRGKAESGYARKALIDWEMQMDDYVRISNLTQEKR